MTYHAGFLQDIIGHPDDDAPRLIYADWLEEHGDPDRAEFIRVQCAAEKVRAACLCGDCVRRRGGGQHHNGPCGLDRREHGFLRRRERELLTAHQVDWRAADMPRLPWMRLVTDYRRGFVAEVTLPCALWLEHGPALVRTVPLEKVSLTDVRPYYSTAFPGEWAWFLVPEDGPDMDPPSDLPAPIFHALPGEAMPAGPEGTGPPMKLFTGEPAALEGLSAASLKWARCPDLAVH